MFKIFKEFLRWKAGLFLKETYKPKIGEFVYRLVPEAPIGYFMDWRKMGTIKSITEEKEKIIITIEIKKGCAIYQD